MTPDFWAHPWLWVISTHKIKVPSRGPGYHPTPRPRFSSLSLSLFTLRIFKFFTSPFWISVRATWRIAKHDYKRKSMWPILCQWNGNQKTCFLLVHKKRSCRVSKQYKFETVHLVLCCFLSLLHTCNRHWKAQTSMFHFYCNLHYAYMKSINECRWFCLLDGVNQNYGHRN